MKKFKTYIALHFLLFMLSFAAVLSKLAGMQDFLSLSFFLCYGASVGILGVYAIGWQQVIKRLPLSAAYANRAVTVIWGMIWGLLFFAESISVQKIVAAVIIVCGVVMFATAQEGEGNHAE